MTPLAAELVGKTYEIKNPFNNEVTATKTITSAIDVENLAGCIIFLDGATTGLFIGFKEVNKILEGSN